MSHPLEIPELERTIMGVFVRATKTFDARPDAMKPVDPKTGIVLDAADLAPVHHRKSGDALAYELCVSASRMAEAMIARTAPDGSPITMTTIRPEFRTAEEVAAVEDAKHRIQIAMRNLKKRGLVDDRPPISFDGAPMELDEGGFAFEVKVTHKGLSWAKQALDGTRYAQGPKSILAHTDEATRRAAPEHAQAALRQEQGGQS